jgi:hypothetical protein
MSDSIFKITMKENGEHSFKKGIDAYEEYMQKEDHMLLKDAIMFLHHGIELLMKEILARHSPFLIFEELKDLPRKQKLADQKGISIFSIDNPPRTVSYEVAIERVEAFIKPAELDKPLLDNLTALTKLRNKLEHHEIEADRREVIDLLIAVHDPALRLFETQLGRLEQFHSPRAKSVWNNIVHDEELTRYVAIYAERPTDGARINARRVVVDAKMPIRWTITVKDRLEHFIYNELPIFEDAEERKLKHYRASELFELAEKAGFRDWHQAPKGMVEGIELFEGEYRERDFPVYELPDPTNYPID